VEDKEFSFSEIEMIYRNEEPEIIGMDVGCILLDKV
jgi:hypothetical protein